MWKSIEQIKHANKKIGNFWFSEDTMRSFKTKIETGVIHGEYFISSDCGYRTEDRYFTARKADKIGRINTVEGTRSQDKVKCMTALIKHIGEQPKKIRFVNIDDWNRPVFKQVNATIYYGSLDKLFPYGTPETEVLKTVTGTDLVYFGRGFNCEPMGSIIDGLEIIRSEDD